MACAPDAEVETRSVTVHAPRACAVNDAGYALFYASGDFQPASGGPAKGHLLSEVGASLEALPSNTRQLLLDLAAGDDRFTGFTLVPSKGNVDILAWPERRACRLTGDIGERDRKNHQLTVTGSIALVTGGSQTGREVQSFVVDLRTGTIETVASGDDLRAPRARAAATGFANGVLVSGGVRSDGSLVDSAERFVVGPRRAFDLTIPLGTPRADHAAVLMSSGEVLLVSGTGPSGLLDSLEIVDVAGGRARIAALARLAKARRSPRALRLASGEILVIGGFDRDGAPVRTIEWLTRDATRAARPPREIDVGAAQDVIALPAGGALIVTTQPQPMTPTSVVVVTAQGDLETSPTITGNVTQLALFGTSRGAPVLWTGERWLRWQPWLGEFGALSTADATGPSATAAFATGDPALALWADDGGVTGLRVEANVRGTYTAELGPAFRDDPGAFVPDRLVSPTSVSSMTFDPARGLGLPAGGSVFLADATFQSFDLALTYGADGAAPFVVLRAESGDEIEIGGPTCAFPAGEKVTVTRRRSRVEVATSNGTTRCTLPRIGNERVALGLRGARESTSTVREVTVNRRTD